MKIFLWLYLTLTLSCSGTAAPTVKARKVSLMVDTVTTWNTAHRVCQSVGMVLPTVDRHLTNFLRTQASTGVFQDKVKDHFWIGLHDKFVANTSSAPSGYQWVGSCNTLSSWDAWDQDQPSDTDEAFCVYAKNDTFLWYTDKCDATHHFVCEQPRPKCLYNRTEATCQLFASATSKLVLQSSEYQECAAHCDSSEKNSNPCWGFIMGASSCTLYYQSAQPACDVTPSDRGSAFFRTCFQLYYIHGPIFMSASSDKLPVSNCDLLTTTQGTTKPTPVPTTAVTTTATTTSERTTTQTTTQTLPCTSEAMTSESMETSTAKESVRSDVTTEETAGSTSTDDDTVTTESTTETTDGIPATSPAETGNMYTAQAAVLPLVQTAARRPVPVPPVLPKCVCVRDVSATPRNVTSALRAAEETKKLLVIDRKTLSKTRRKHGSATDNRLTAKGMAYFGMAFIALTLSVIVLPDIVTLLGHLRYGAGYYGYAVAKGREKITFTKAVSRKYSIAEPLP